MISIATHPPIARPPGSPTSPRPPRVPVSPLKEPRAMPESLADPGVPFAAPAAQAPTPDLPVEASVPIPRTSHPPRSSSPEPPPSRFGIIGGSPAMLALFDLLDRVLPSAVPVLIEGETGTGKELVARALHQHGPRRPGPWLAHNCAATPEPLLESELFGHARGAFTGAWGERAGLFEAADGGTLFLDEVGEISRESEVKLLRVVQEGEVRRVGDTRSRRVDVRLVAATNRSLEEEVRARRFREDLYYRLRGVRLELPPLRERGEDVLHLARFYLGAAAARWGRNRPELSPEVGARLLEHSWPGNVRELMHEMERALLWLEPGARLESRHLSPEFGRAEQRGGRRGSYQFETDRFKRRLLRETLTRTRGNKSAAARQLGLTRQGFLKLCHRLQVAWEKDGDGNAARR
ncbi:MAG: sigma-54-dependent Fis family transcriptional regulator [Candidatus Eisenbacteria bacterium]|nr:sigma-54-dependent Fis family transcriptional regulator [Candidatus Eisenbacteria bacterium]